MTAKELLDKINEETILQISIPEVAIRIINEAKIEWCKQQRIKCWENIMVFGNISNKDSELILNTPEP